jgi:hypothetical protein
MSRRRKMMGYREAIRWVLTNDDTSFLDDVVPDEVEPIASVTVAFLADVYDRTQDEVVADLLKQQKGDE